VTLNQWTPADVANWQHLHHHHTNAQNNSQKNRVGVQKSTKHASAMYRDGVDGLALQALQDKVSSSEHLRSE
jgi:hypothetical protein